MAPPAIGSSSSTQQGGDQIFTSGQQRRYACELIPVEVYSHANDACQAVAAHIATCIRRRATEGNTCVLGLATGSTPVDVYDELVRIHREDGLSFANVVTFNLDEYFSMQPNRVAELRAVHARAPV